MNISRIVSILAVFVCLCLVGCANSPGPQYGLRGYPNAPHQRVQPLVVNQNAIYSMTPEQFNEYQRRVNWATQYNRQLIQNDQAASNAAKGWVNNPNSYQNDGFGRIRTDAVNTFSNEMSRAISDGIRDIFN